MMRTYSAVADATSGTWIDWNNLNDAEFFATKISNGVYLLTTSMVINGKRITQEKLWRC